MYHENEGTVKCELIDTLPGLRERRHNISLNPGQLCAATVDSWLVHQWTLNNEHFTRLLSVVFCRTTIDLTRVGPAMASLSREEVARQIRETVSNVYDNNFTNLLNTIVHLKG